MPDESKREVVEQTALKHGLSKQIIEKDLWVSTLLEIIFTLPFADKLVFKGGTSLSKVWGLIDRFYEDIDLAIDRSLFGLDGDLTVRQLKKLRKASSFFTMPHVCPWQEKGRKLGMKKEKPLRTSLFVGAIGVEPMTLCL